MFKKLKRKLRDRLLGEGPRFYGGDQTIHGNDSLDVEVDKNGRVVAVWFRCSIVPFRQHDVDDHRAKAMTRAASEPVPGIEAIIFTD